MRIQIYDRQQDLDDAVAEAELRVRYFRERGNEAAILQHELLLARFQAAADANRAATAAGAGAGGDGPVPEAPARQQPPPRRPRPGGRGRGRSASGTRSRQGRTPSPPARNLRPRAGIRPPKRD